MVTCTAPQIGDAQRVAGLACVIAALAVVDGVRYELYRGADQNGGALRVFDADAGAVVRIVRYPSSAAAEHAYGQLLQRVRPMAGPLL
jgi:hypothetical protein